MRFQVINGNQRLCVFERQHLARDEANHQPTNQTRPGRCCNGVQIAECCAGLAHGFRDQSVKALHMRPSRDLGHDAAKLPVPVPLGTHNIGAYPPMSLRCTRYNGGGSFVTTRFNAQNP